MLHLAENDIWDFRASVLTGANKISFPLPLMIIYPCLPCLGYANMVSISNITMSLPFYEMEFDF